MSAVCLLIIGTLLAPIICAIAIRYAILRQAGEDGRGQ
jgi:hypothetical protein